MLVEIQFLHRWELHVNILSEYIEVILIWDSNLKSLDVNMTQRIKFW
jgi:hypothetical protein